MKSYALVITMADEITNEFLELGGAAWLTRKEQMSQWRSIPAIDGQSCILLDRHAANDDLEDTKQISAETASALLGKPLNDLVASARREIESYREKRGGCG